MLILFLSKTANLLILIISPLALVILMGIVKVTTSVVFASVPVIPVTVIFL